MRGLTTESNDAKRCRKRNRPARCLCLYWRIRQCWAWRGDGGRRRWWCEQLQGRWPWSTAWRCVHRWCRCSCAKDSQLCRVESKLLLVCRYPRGLTRPLLCELLHVIAHGSQCVSKCRQVGSVRIGLLRDTGESRALRRSWCVEPFDLLAQRDKSFFQCVMRVASGGGADGGVCCGSVSESLTSVTAMTGPREESTLAVMPPMTMTATTAAARQRRCVGD